MLTLELHADNPEAIREQIDTLLADHGVAADYAPIQAKPSDQRGLGEALGIIGFILTLPGAIEDWTGYPAKQKTQETLRALVEWAKTLPDDTDLRLRYGDHRSIDLRRHAPDSIIDELALLRRP